jgi:transposase
VGSNRAKKIKRINEKTLIASLDIGKVLHYAYFRAPDGSDIKPFSFPNNRHGFKEFWQGLNRFKSQHGLEEIVIGFESSGPYAEPFFHYLNKKPVKLVQINPMHSKRVKELTGNSPNKTDRKDPRVIADVISLGHALTVVIPQGAAADLRRLTQARERAIKSRTAVNNQLHDGIFVIFPEFLQVMKNTRIKTSMYLIKHHPAPESIAGMGVKSLGTVLKRVSRGKLGGPRAEELYEAAKASVGIDEGKQSLLLEIEHLIGKIEKEEQFIDKLEKQMAQYLEQIPYSRSLLSVKGIGIITAAGLIGEAGDFRNFDTISEITKLAGLDLYEISSGKHQGQRRISKRGRPLMRKLLFFAAINTVKSKGIMHEPYQQMLDRGMLKIKALVAVSRKLLRLIFALVRDNSVYVENHSQIHGLKLAA